MDFATMERESREHLLNPKAGDYWHEMFTPICVVLEVGADVLTLCRSIEAVKDGWTWNLTKRETKTRREFAKWLSYESIPDKTWCHVISEHHLWAVEEFKRLTAAALAEWSI